MSSFSWSPLQTPSSGVPTYANLAAFPSASAAGDGALAIALDTHTLYESNGTTWLPIAGPGSVLSIGTFDSGTPSANGAHIDTNLLIMQSASASNPGLVNISTQTFAGAKTFASILIPSLTSGQLLYPDGTGLLTSSANLAWDASLFKLTLAGVTGATPSLYIQNASATFTPHFLYEKNENATATNAPLIVLRRSRGTTGAPVAVQSGDLLGSIIMRGYGTSAYQASGSRIYAFATEAYSNTANGTSLALYTTPNTTITPKQRIVIGQDGALQLVGNTSGILSIYPAATTSTYSITMPSAQGSLNSVLTNDGSGGLTWVDNTTTGYITALTGDVTATGPGSATATIVNLAVTNAKIANTTIDLTTKVTGILPNANTTATSANTNSAIVARDGSGNFTATTITAALTGNATTATTATTATNATNTAIIDDSTTNATMYPTWVTTTTGNLPQKISSTKLTFNPSTAALTTASFIGALTGTASGNTTYSANNHGVVLSSATNAMTVVAPDASTTKVLTSGGASADPTWALITAAMLSSQGAARTATFTTAATSSTSTLYMYICTGGGGGGGAASNALGAAGGGGAGGTAFGVFSGVAASTSITVVTGTGGTAGASGGNGGDGTDSTISATGLSTITGAKGRLGNGNTGVGAAGGGAGGTGTGGTLNVTGGAGFNGASGVANVTFGGAGGASFWGGGGVPGVPGAGNASAGSGFGSGGGGAAATGAGATGANGIVIIIQLTP